MDQTISILKKGGIGVMPTDTLYGLVGSALMSATVERIYVARERDANKPLIVLISSADDLAQFNILLSEQEQKMLEKLWPGKVSVILPCHTKEFSYLHRGTNTIAFRVPVEEKLQSILAEVGPLVAPSANLQGKDPAKTIEEARSYFGDTVDFYEDGGILSSLPSTLVELKNGRLKVLREGAVKI